MSTSGEFSDYRNPADYVRAFLAPPPNRVLEIGCGSGELAVELARENYDIIAIDPEAPDGLPFRKTTFEAFEGTGHFASIIAMRVLHHIPDLEGAVDKMAQLLEHSGRLIIEEFGWELLDEPNLEWFYARMRALGRGPRNSPPPESLDECRGAWRREHEGLHPSTSMLEALARHFDRRMFAWTDYLCRLLKDAEGRREEIDALTAGRINPIAFRYVGVLKSHRTKG